MSNRHALIIVFEYSYRPKNADLPPQLLAMDVDLKLAYDLSVNRFNIPPCNITVLTDLQIKRGVMNPWDPLSRNPNNNPRIVRLKYPNVVRVCSEITRFVENTVRGIGDGIAINGKKNEVFFYVSCHGAQIMKSYPNYKQETDSALILTSTNGRRRMYLRDDDIFRLLFGQIDINNGIMNVPVTTRDIISSKGRVFHSFENDTISFEVPRGIRGRTRLVRANSQDEYKIIKDRGIPPLTHMLVILDACHSGTMTDFFYIYDPKTRKMKLNRNHPNKSKLFPYCVCLAAAQDEQVAPSTSKGSAFTRYIYQLLNSLSGRISIRRLHSLMYRNLPNILSKCKPTVTATIEHSNYVLPFLDVKLDGDKSK